jgi:hypothetical protein
MDAQSDRIERVDIDFVSYPAQGSRDVAKEDGLAVIKWAVMGPISRFSAAFTRNSTTLTRRVN